MEIATLSLNWWIKARKLKLLQGLCQKGKWLQMSHTQFEHATYMHKGRRRKNGFIWQNGKTWWVGASLKSKGLSTSSMQCPPYIWSLWWIGVQPRQSINSQIAWILRKLLPDEIKSFHYRQDPPPMYPIVVFQKVNEDVRKDHITLLTNDKKNDTPFVELSNSHLLEHYGCKGVSITHDME